MNGRYLMLVHSICQFHVFFRVRMILHYLAIPSPHEIGFGKVKNSYIKSEYYSSCDYFGDNTNESDNEVSSSSKIEYSR